MNSSVIPTPTTMQQSVSPTPPEFGDELGPTVLSVDTGEVSRPRVRFDSQSAFFVTLWGRFASVWSKKFTLGLLGGQLVSLCVTCTDVTTTELFNRGWRLPTTQTLFLYFSLFIVYTPYTIYKYFILAACDVEGNFLVVKAYQYTDLLSCMLLNSWAIPTCLFFSWLFMRVRYAWTQLAGVLICVGGLGMLVASDQLTDKDWRASNKVKGDLFMLAGATLYGFTNAAEEFLVRQSPLYEVVGQLGMWGTLISGVQAASLEHKGMRDATWNGQIAGFLLAYTTAMFGFYTAAPMIYRLTSSVFYNLNLLSANFFGLLFEGYRPFWLYFVAFPVIVVGLICYFWSATPESQGTVDPRLPSYIHPRNDKQASRGDQA
ncbi:DUF914-domain-containing protein [Thelephora ganbajun]|uniref:DUF914-domain-containing protein n=1 Tax=Thelephora ganbajun TaxID=370292 RepID=A0ACB6Z0P1_THEGA|nr:DUF914-domain-containing protein [Thelephora ganbajun]